MAVNTFRDHDIDFVTCNVDHSAEMSGGAGLRDAGCFPGCLRKQKQEKPTRNLMQAWQAAHEKHTLQEEEARLHDDRIKILVVGHSYNLYDEYIGKPIMKGIEQLDAVPICSDAVDLKQAQDGFPEYLQSRSVDHEPRAAWIDFQISQRCGWYYPAYRIPVWSGLHGQRDDHPPDQRPPDPEPAAGQPGRKCRY